MAGEESPSAEGAPELAIFGALSPHMIEAEQRLRSGKCRLVHYTSSANALNIINSERFWLRNVRCMNDYSEVQHGLNLLIKTFNDDDGLRRNRLLSAFGERGAKSAQEAMVRFDSLIPTLPVDTFIGCLSEHEAYNPLGRLSMWRSYGQSDGGVAIFMNSAPFVAETDNLKAYTVPVSYLTDTEFVRRLSESRFRSFRSAPSNRITASN